MSIPVILGPTAVGKTDLLLWLSEKYPIEVISLDSRQVYKYMDIGTAKPTMEERERLPHHLVDICEPDSEFDVYRFRQLALAAERDVLSRDKIPVFAGGSGLYADSILKGLVKNLPRNDTVRAALRTLEEENPGFMKQLLSRVDPVASGRIHPNDLKRMQRYLEAFFISGKQLSSMQREETISERFTVILVDRKRDELHSRIGQRVDKMRCLGLVEEVQKLLVMGFGCGLNAMKTIGYAEICDLLAGSKKADETFELIKRNTRRFARRQMIWFRRYKNSSRLNLSTMERSSIEKAFAGLFDSFWGDYRG